MTVKRVTDSYAKGLQAVSGARRTTPPPNSPAGVLPTGRALGARPSPIHATLPNISGRQAEAQPERQAISDNALAAIAADLAKFQESTKPESGQIDPVDYHEIVANTVAALEHSSVESRHTVYECARQVVHQRLAAIQPPLPADLIAREHAALDHAIEQIEVEARKTEPNAAPSQTPSAQPIQPVVIAKSRPNLPQVKQFRGGVLRLFTIVGVTFIVALAYWLIAGKPTIKTAANYFPGLPNSTAATGPAPGADVSSPDAPPASPPDATPAVQDDADVDRASGAVAPRTEAGIANTARALAENPLINLNIDCASPPCGPDGAQLQTTGRPDIQAWIATYGSMAPAPPRVAPAEAPPANAKARTRLMETGRAAAVPTAASHYENGISQSSAGDSESAIRAFTEAIRLDPNFGEAYLQRGNMRFKNGNADLALMDFHEAVRIDPRNAGAYKARGMARLYTADEAGALEDLTRAIQIAEAEPGRLPLADLFFARRSRATMYSRRQMSDRELFDLSAMIDAYWKNPDLADALKGNYGPQGATALMATIYRQRAALYVQRANSDGAVADLSFALQLDPARALQFTMERARVQDAAGRREQATADYQRALAINPRIDEAKQAIARLKAR